MTAEATVTEHPGLVVLKTHLGSARFMAGEDDGRWRAQAPAWPNLIVNLIAPGGSVSLRFDLVGYPNVAPTSTPWDQAQNCVLDARHWPTGTNTSRVFNPGWAKAKGWALYFPLDRVAASDHQNWFTESPDLAWNGTKTICDYLDYVSNVLRGAKFP